MSELKKYQIITIVVSVTTAILSVYLSLSDTGQVKGQNAILAKELVD